MKNSAWKFAFHSVVLIAVIAFAATILNLGLLFAAAWAGQSGLEEVSVREISEALITTKDSYILSSDTESLLDEFDLWAMLIGQDGRVLWSYALPDDVPTRYTLTDVASFSRWYLSDYPVRVWNHGDGLLVVGAPKDSMWKYPIEFSMEMVEILPRYFLVAILSNLLLIFGMSVLFTRRWFQKRDEARTEWIAGISHDIRTPLSMVMGYSSQLEENHTLPPEAREQAGIVRCQSEKIKGLVRDLNLISKLEYEMQPLRISKVSPAALIREAAADFLNSSQEDRCWITVDISADAEHITLHADEALLRRALNNLIGNSFRHNQEGCEIGITLEMQKRWCVITLTDNGSGYPADVLKNLNRADFSKASQASHGLVIVKQIVQAHHGKISFGNLPSGGCVCVLRLPKR